MALLWEDFFNGDPLDTIRTKINDFSKSIASVVNMNTLNIDENTRDIVDLQTSLEELGAADMAEYSKEVDFIEASNLIYIGEALPSAMIEEASWRIKRINLNTGVDSDIQIRYAGGNSNFDKVWSNHLSLSYI